jgi:hypothetical protein
MWPPGGEFVHVNWKKGSLLPEGWYHAHFTTSLQAARHLALRRGLRGIGPLWLPTLSERESRNQLEYEEEPLEVRALYEAELNKESVPLRMPQIKKGISMAD